MSRAEFLSRWHAVAIVSGVIILSALSTAFSLRAGEPPQRSGGAFSAVSARAYYYPASVGYGGYFSPFLGLPSAPLAYGYLPNYWWVSSYPIADPRQDGYNPSAGYAWGGVMTLVLDTTPTKARIVLDGLFVGTTDKLGPFQLPIGEHTLRVEADGYEPSETALKVEQPFLEQLEVRLTPTKHAAKPGPPS